MSNQEYKTLLHMTNEQAKEFFLKSHAYCNINLPTYFCFNNVLKDIYKYIQEKPINFKENKPKIFADVNYKIRTNKDGLYDWRLFELINPILYVDLVIYLTDNWEYIIEKIKNHIGFSSVVCESFPIVTLENDQKEKTISRWVERVERESIIKSMEFDYLFVTDISNCYPSIYTHAIEWAIETKESGKSGKNFTIGAMVDTKVRNMTYGQTNGIPQGSVLMDFIAELVLTYSDSELTKKIIGHGINKKDYYILRYRDDYRIFSNNKDYIDIISRELAITLQELGMKTNPSKTFFTEDVVLGSLKKDKLQSLLFFDADYQKETIQNKLIKILIFCKENRNSNQINSKISRICKSIEENGLYGESPKVLIGVVVEILKKNPCGIEVCAQLISLLLNCIENYEEKKDIIELVEQRLNIKLNTGLIDIWMQRITFPILGDNKKFKEKLCDQVKYDNSIFEEELWNNEWVKDQKLRSIVKESMLYNFDTLSELENVIQDEEIFVLNTQQY